MKTLHLCRRIVSQICLKPQAANLSTLKISTLITELSSKSKICDNLSERARHTLGHTDFGK